MKKIIYVLILLIFPFNVFAYSEYIIPGGETLGIEINSDGVLIVGYYKVNGDEINQDLHIGDRITYINNEKVNSVDNMVDLIDKYMKDETVDIKYIRNNKEYDGKLELSYFNGTYRTGLYVKGNVIGIGTLTYIDPSTQVYGILGHVINESKSNTRVEVRDGFTYVAKVKNFVRSVDGNPGSKNANIFKNNIFGNVKLNTNYGVFGQVSKSNNKEALKVAAVDEVQLGSAYISTTNENNEVLNYEIKVIEIIKDNKEKNFFFEVIDEELISMSGGIVQGMSGSPIIQNNQIIGAVTRVLVDDVSRGYGISIITMLEEGDKIINKN